jgi:putative membrane protein
MLEAQAGPGFGLGLPLLILGVLFFVVMLGGLIVGLVLVSRVMKRGRSASSGLDESPEALAVLKLRYARGELGREEFERMRKDIE